MRPSQVLLVLSVLVAQPAHCVFASQSTLPGIAFTVDTTPDLAPQGLDVLKPLGLRVTYAGSRGRIDVLARPSRPVIKVGEVVVALPLAAAGDYYLFDSTGFILVQPTRKEFFTFRIADASFNFSGRRDGWPEFFRFARAGITTISDTAPQLLTQHGEHRIYWHLDVVKDTACGLAGCSIEELARGRAAAVDAPAEQLLVMRWFGPAQALAEIPGGISRLLAKPIRVTTVSSVTGVHRLLDLRVTAVDVALLTLPSDFTEAPWPGFAASPAMLSSDRGAKWRAKPQP